MDKALKSGVYIIKNLITSKFYIGSAVDMRRRLNYHRWTLKRGDCCNIHLQRAWDKYGENSFSFEKFLSCKREDLIFFEQLTIDASITRYGRKNVYNSSLTAGSTLGKFHSEETKKKIGLKSKGRWTGKHHTEETKEKIRLGNIGVNQGKIHSEESRKKMSENRKGKKFSEEHKKNLAESIKKSWERRRKSA